MACLQKHKFENKFCNNEINKFNECFSNYMAKKTALKANREKGILTPNADYLNHRELNILLKKFPNK